VTQVVRREGESFEKMLRRFRKKVNRSRILSTVKKNRYFVSESEQRRIALRKAVRRQRKRQRKQRRRYGKA
jgi:small subunit ribosomal protein S21